MVRHTGATKWRPVEGFLGRRGVVYDLSRPAGARAALYVVDGEVEGLRTAPTLHPFDNCWIQLLRVGVAGGPVAVCSCRAR